MLLDRLCNLLLSVFGQRTQCQCQRRAKRGLIDAVLQ